jgi:pimeloyl-ACP methyl ester carboxylesterase
MTKEIPLSHHTLEVNGIHLHYASWGQFRTPERAVLLVHGLASNHMIWGELGPLLAERGWYVIAPDLRGRGWSEKPAHGTGIPYHVNDLLALCDALGLAHVHFVGHSLGALIGYFFAAIHPQRLDQFVAIDAGKQVSPHILEILRPVLGRLGQVYPSLDAYLQQIQQASASVHPWNDFWESYYRFEGERRRDGTVSVRSSKTAIEEEMAVNSVIQFDLLFQVIQAPTLIMYAGLGTYQPDWFILAENEAERIHNLIKGSHLEVIPDGNHYTIIHSEIFKDHVLHFLEADISS